MSQEKSPLFVGADKITKSTIVFNSDSDTDSINTDSTAESDAREEYEVERILMEVNDQEHCYLVKWEGYKLSRSTWEPPESLVGGEILAEWEREKKRIESGQSKPFDCEEYFKAFEEAEQEKKSKRMRRNAKRLKRGLPIRTYSSEESQAEDGEVEGSSTDDQSVGMMSTKLKRHPSPKASPKATKRVKRPETVRKGVASRVQRKRVVSDRDSSSGESSSDDDRSSSADSLQEELVAGARRPSTRKKGVARLRAEPSPPRNSTSVSSSKRVASTTAPKPPATTQTAKPSAASAAASAAAAVAKKNTATEAPHRAGPSGAGRKSAPSHVEVEPAKAARDVLANWDVPKQRRERQRVSGETPKDSAEPKFKALSILGRYQKYGRENEKPPNFDALTIIDPKTGLTRPPKAPHVQPVPASSAYSRRTPPPPDTRRSLTPPSPKQAPAVPKEHAINPSPICKGWLTSGCPKSAKDCNSIHPLSRFRVNHVPDKKMVTCYFWLASGRCEHGPRCAFAHADTGIYSSSPGSHGGFFAVTLPSADDLPPPPPPLSPPRVSLNQPQRAAVATTQLRPHHPGHPACRAWLEGNCPNSAQSCSYAHALPTEPYKGNLESVEKRQVFCYYQETRGTCIKGNSCPFSHVDTGIQAGAPGGGFAGRTNRIPRTNSIVPSEVARSNSIVSKPEAIARGLSLRDVTCYFWRTRGGRCGKSDAECEYAHIHTGIWAAPPPGHSESRLDLPIVGNANTIPVTGRRAGSSITHAITPDSVSRGADGDGDVLMETFGPPAQVSAAPMPPPARETSRRQPSVSTPAGVLNSTISVSYSGDWNPTQVQVKLELSELRVWGDLVGAEPQLTIGRAVLASDFRTLVWDDQLCDVEFTVGSVVVSDVTTGKNIVDLCKQHTVGLIAVQAERKAKMLIYPASDDLWKFLDAGSGMSWKSDAPLRFRLFSNIPDTEHLLTSKPLRALSSSQRRLPASISGEQLAKLDAARLMPFSDKHNQGRLAVFLMFPSTHHAELQFYTKFFGEQDYQVYHSGIAGAWHYFRRSDCRKVLMVHPDVPLWQIPGLRHLLKTGMTMFSIGLNRLDSIDDPTLSCERLFPYATAVLFTDQVFLYHPEKALEILDGFLKTVKGRQEYKVVTRPGIKDWMFHLAGNSDSAGHDNINIRLYNAICRLCPPEDEDPHDPPNPRPGSNLVSLSTELFPNYHDLFKKDESAAAEFLVEWFASWTIEHARKLRKLYVFYEPKNGFGGALNSAGQWVTNEDPFGWGKRYEHINFLKPENVFRGK